MKVFCHTFATTIVSVNLITTLKQCDTSDYRLGVYRPTCVGLRMISTRYCLARRAEVLKKIPLRSELHILLHDTAISETIDRHFVSLFNESCCLS